MIYSLLIGCKPMTFNMAYPTGAGGRRYLTEEGKTYKNFIKMCCKHQIKNFEIPKSKSVLRSTFVFCKPDFITTKGAASKNAGDADGFIKLIQDAIADALGFNDSLIWDVRSVKAFDEYPKIFVELEWVSMENYMHPHSLLKSIPLNQLD